MSDSSTTESLAPWESPEGAQWLQTFQPWRQMRRLIHGTLMMDPTEHAHEIRAAASMVILFCRPGLWPVGDQESITPVIETAARQLLHVKQLYEAKGRIRPELQSSKSFRKLLRTLDEEIRILESRMADPKPKMPNVPPCSWSHFWE